MPLDNEPVASQGRQRRRLTINLVWSSLGRMGAVGAGFIATALLTRLLPPDEVGVYYLVQSIVLMVGPLANLSLQEPTVRAIAGAIAVGDRPGAVAFARAALRASTISGLVVAALCLIGCVVVTQSGLVGNLNDPSVAVLMGAWIAILAIESQLVGTLQGLERISAAATYDSMLGKLLSMIVLATMWALTGQATVVKVLSGFVGCEGFSLVMAALSVHRALSGLGASGKFVGPRELWRTTWPFLAQLLATALTAQSGILILGLFRSPAEVAIYGTASRLSVLLSIPAAIVNVPVAPSVARLHAQGKRTELQKLLQSTAAGPTIIAICATLWWAFDGGFVLGKLFGPAYRDGELVLVILGLGQCVNLCFGSCMVALAMTGEQRVATRISIIAVILQTLLLLSLAYPFGPVGVAVASVVAATCTKVMGWWEVHRRLGIYTHAGIEKIGMTSRMFFCRVVMAAVSRK